MKERSKRMKQGFKRIAAAIMAVLLLLTAQGTAGIATVAQACEYPRIDACVQKRAYDVVRNTDWQNSETENVILDEAGNWQKEGQIACEDARLVGTPVIYEYELKPRTCNPLYHLYFDDDTLGVHISEDCISLGSYSYTKPDGTVVEVPRDLGDLVLTLGEYTYRISDIAAQYREPVFKYVLQRGVQANQRILISGIRSVLNDSTVGPVVATMYGLENKDPNCRITRCASHSAYAYETTVQVSHTAHSIAKDGCGNPVAQYPSDLVLQDGTPAEYTIVMCNAGGASLTRMHLADEVLGVAFGVDEWGNPISDLSGEAAEALSPEAPITIQVQGTGVADGSYTVGSVAEYQRLANRLGDLVYAPGAQIFIDGVRHNIVQTVDSVVAGTGSPINGGYDQKDREDMYGRVIGRAKAGWMAYAVRYRAYLDGQANAPDVRCYVNVTNENYETICAYQCQLHQLIAAVKNCGIQGECVTVQSPFAVPGYREGRPQTASAEVILNGTAAEAAFYSQAGQQIFGSVQQHGKTAALTGAETPIGEFTVTEADKTLVVYHGQQQTPDIRLKQVNLYRDGGLYAFLNVADRKADTSSAGMAGDALVLGAGESATFPLHAEPGIYTVALVTDSIGAEASVAVGGILPGDYVLVDEAGNELAAEADGTVRIDGQCTARVDNSDVYPALSYQSGVAGTKQVYLAQQGNPRAVLTPVTVYTYDVTDDVYVLDYGLNVSLNAETGANDNGMFLNDQLALREQDAAVFTGVRAVTEKVDRAKAGYGTHYTNDFVPAYGTVANRVETDAQGNEIPASYGTVTVSGAMTVPSADLQVVYQLNSFLEGMDRYTYGVQVGAREAIQPADGAAVPLDCTNATPIMEANVTIMPASVVYYEDNFAASILTNGTVDGISEEELQNNSLHTQYGYDETYKADIQASNGTYTVLAGNDSIAFTFQGTGFDILTRTSNANLYVAVYDAAEYELASYKYGDHGNTIYYAVKKNGQSAAGPINTAYINAYNENQDIHHIPLISMKMDRCGTYLVIATKVSGTDVLYVDGIRIYEPMGKAFSQISQPEKTEAEAAYRQAEGELKAEQQNVRNMILGTGYEFRPGNAKNPVKEGKNIIASLAKVKDGVLYATQGSTVVECYTGSIDAGTIANRKGGALEDRADAADQTSSLLAYAVSGPNNELYLTGTEYVFAAAVKEETPDAAVQIGLKAVKGSSNVQYLSKETAEDGSYIWKSLQDAESVSTTTEMYYKVDLDDLKVADGKKILVLRAENTGKDQYILALTNLKYTGVQFEKPEASTLVNTTEGMTVENDRVAGTFEMLTLTPASKKFVLTFSIPDEVETFAIAQRDEVKLDADRVVTGATGRTVMTYDGRKHPNTTASKGNAKVSYRPVDGSKIYVVQLDKKALKNGTYVIYTTAKGENGNGYAAAEFTIP